MMSALGSTTVRRQPGASTRLDLSAPVPLYRQLEELLRDRIISGEWAEGTQIPPEPQLCSTFGISRITVRQAVEDLVREGWLYRRRGRGTFVRSAKPEIQLSSLFLIHPHPLADSGVAEHEPMHTRTVTPRALVRRRLALPPAARAFEIVRVRLVNGKPAALETAYLPRDLMRRVPTTEELRRGFFYDILRSSTGLEPAHTRIYLEAILVDRRQGEILKIPPGSPALRLERLTSSAGGRPVLITVNIVAGDHCRYVLDVDLASLGATASGSHQRT
jgi:GntR family transcriptional regulator